jgi:hypothetical protein
MTHICISMYVLFATLEQKYRCAVGSMYVHVCMCIDDSYKCGCREVVRICICMCMYVCMYECIQFHV